MNALGTDSWLGRAILGLLVLVGGTRLLGGVFEGFGVADDPRRPAEHGCQNDENEHSEKRSPTPRVRHERVHSPTSGESEPSSSRPRTRSGRAVAM